MVRLHTLMVAGLAGQRWRLYSLELSIWRVARCVPPSHAISRGWNRGAARLAFDRLDCASVAAKRGHLEIQKGPLGVKRGQYPTPGTGRNRPLARPNSATRVFLPRLP